MEEAYVYVRRKDSHQSVIVTGGYYRIDFVMALEKVKYGPIEENSCSYYGKRGIIKTYVSSCIGIQLSGRTAKDKIDRLIH